MNLAKKLIAVLLVFAVLFAFSACSLTEENSEILDIGTVNIGIILNGEVEDEATVTGKQYKAFISACNNSGAGGNQINEQVNIPAGDSAAMDKAMADLISRGCRLIVGVDDGYYSDFVKYAKENANIFFVLLADYDTERPEAENLSVFCMNTFESDYIQGVMAALSSVNGKIGYVADADTKKADVNAFLLGAKSANDKATVSVITLKDGESDTSAAIDTLIKASCDVLYTKNYEIGEDDEKTAYFTAPDSVKSERCLIKLVNTEPEFISATHVNYETAFVKVVTDTVNDKFAELKNYSSGIKDGAIDIRPAADDDLKATADDIKTQLYDDVDILAGYELKNLCSSYLEGITEL